MLTALALTLAIRVSPPKPAIGDLITIDTGKGPVALQKSSDYEVVSQNGGRVVVRTFVPKPFTVDGTAGGEAFRQVVPVRSALKPKDDLTPAPLAPPRPEPKLRLPSILIAVAALLAVAAWTWLLFRARRERSPEIVLPPLTAVERYRTAVEALRASPRTPKRWSRLAEALRDSLAASHHLIPDRPTTELLAPADGPGLAEVLHTA